MDKEEKCVLVGIVGALSCIFLSVANYNAFDSVAIGLYTAFATVLIIAYLMFRIADEK